MGRSVEESLCQHRCWGQARLSAFIVTLYGLIMNTRMNQGCFQLFVTQQELETLDATSSSVVRAKRSLVIAFYSGPIAKHLAK